MTSTPQRITDRTNLPPLTSPETDTLDWKREVDPQKRQELAKDIAAMANSSGGSIVIGVKEGSASVPAALQPLSRAQARSLSIAYEHAARDLISPPVKIDVCIIELEYDGSDKFVVAVNIQPTEAIFCGIKTIGDGSRQGQDSSWQVPKRVASQTKYLSPAEAQLATVERLRSATQQTLSLIENWQHDLAQREAVRRFEDFMAHESHHDIRFPELKSESNPLGLEYTIQPVLDATGSPLSNKNEMTNRWVIKIAGPAQEDVISPEDLKEYENSPIHDNEYYYCEFYNGSWHLSSDGWTSHSFYLSGKVGQVEHMESANSFVKRHRPQEAGHLVEVFHVVLSTQGVRGQKSGNLFSVLKNNSDKYYLCINDSPPKPIYLTNPTDTYGNDDWYLEIEHLRGHGDPGVQKNIRDSIRNELEQRGINLPRVPWYNTHRAGRL